MKKDRDAYKCTGVCSTCGRCRLSEMTEEIKDRESGMLILPEDFEPDKNTGQPRRLGVAVDIGTTTVAASLWQLDKGRFLAAHAETNPQTEFGADLISRITCCIRDPEGTEKLRKPVVECIENMAGVMCDMAGEDCSRISNLVICGNTAMSHIVMGYSPASLAVAPFRPLYEGSLEVGFKELKGSGEGIIPAEARTFVVPNIGGHIGGDITAGIIASRLTEREEMVLFIDIGTNGEIVLKDGDKMLACSAAAGPALEGAAISCGMRAENGAIEKALPEDGGFCFRTIGETEPKGICGSGLIDIVAGLLTEGMIDGSGRIMTDKVAASGITVSEDSKAGQEELIIWQGNDDGRKVFITQQDIRQLQLAKGAIRSGIEVLLGKVSKEAADIDRIIVAGAFGNYINKENALKIGILPPVEPEKIIMAGNGAGKGAAMILTSVREQQRAETIPELVTYIELAEEKDFQELFIGALDFD